MSVVVRPATKARFDDVAIMLGPKNPDSSVCWCLGHRLDWKTNRALAGPARGEYVRGVSRALLDGAVAYARSHGAPAVEGYPVDNQGQKVDSTMAYVGIRTVFEKAGFAKAADTTAVSGGFPRVLMRLDLR